MQNKAKDELKNTFTAYWHFLAVRAACEVGVFEMLAKQAASAVQLREALSLADTPMSFLLSFLEEENYISENQGVYTLSEKGALLTEAHPESLKNACLLWGQEHLTAWQNLSFTLRTGKSSFEAIFQTPFFSYLGNKDKVKENYHLAMREYARDDYKNITNCIDFSAHKTIADVGGSLGEVIGYIAEKEPEANCILFDLPEVVKNVSSNNFEVIGGDFFKPLPFLADAILLCRVLHDWGTESAVSILSHCKKALKPSGKIYVTEILQNKIKTDLLSLNMLLICGSTERTEEEYCSLFTRAGLKYLGKKPLNALQHILIAE